MSRWSTLALIALLTLTGCDNKPTVEPTPIDHGDPGTPNETPLPEDPDDPVGPVEENTCADTPTSPVADVPVRVLTSLELNNALGSLFPGLRLDPIQMQYDSRVASFVLNSRESVSAAHVRDFQRMAEDVADEVARNIDVVAPCDDPDPGLEQHCGQEAVEALGARAFRRPLRPEEEDGLVALYQAGYQIAGHSEGMRYAVQGILQSPSFMYVGEIVQPPVTPHQLTQYEIAQRMAALLWRSPPDEELLDAARESRLADPEVREQHARRMLKDRRGIEAMRSFVFQWLGIDRLDREPFAQRSENAELVDAMTDESRRLVDHVLTQGDASWSELLTADYTFVDDRIAEHYGVSPDAGEPLENGVRRVELSDNRTGLLTHASFLALNHGPVHRGLAVRRRLLCGSIPQPVGVDTQAIPTEPGESERSRSQKRLEEDSCSGCHQMMDPVGLAFDPFDDLGVHRTRDEHGNPVSGEGEVLGTRDADGPVDGAAELATRIAGSEDARECMAKNLFVWTYARLPRSEDMCKVARFEEVLAQNDDDLREAFVAVVTDETFSTRVSSGDEQ